MAKVTDGIKYRVRRLMPRQVRPHRILAGPLKGRRLVTSWHDYPAAILGYTEHPLLQWFQENARAGQTWIDVGAHYGYTALALSELVGPQGRVFAFEPALSTAVSMNRTRALNQLSQLTVVPLALAASHGLHALKAPLVRGMADHLASRPSGGQETMFAIAFDEIWPSLNSGDGPIDGIKIDVQGMEIDVIRGMTHALAAHRPLLVLEFHAGVDRATLLRVLGSAGYHTSGRSLEPLSEAGGVTYRDNHSYCFGPS